MSDANRIFGCAATQVIVPAGGSFSILITPPAGTVSQIVKYFTGGSLEIDGALAYNTPSNPGATQMVGASVYALNGTGYILGTTEMVSIDGPMMYYLSATGATATAMVLFKLSQGF